MLASEFSQSLEEYSNKIAAKHLDDRLPGAQLRRDRRVGCPLCAALHIALHGRPLVKQAGDSDSDDEAGHRRAAAAAVAAPPPTTRLEPAEDFSEVGADPTEEALLGVVARVFGFDGFRGHQLPVIQKVLAQESTLAIMPTGKCSSWDSNCPPWHADGLGRARGLRDSVWWRWAPARQYN
jgi:hypothetical protein